MFVASCIRRWSIVRFYFYSSSSFRLFCGKIRFRSRKSEEEATLSLSPPPSTSPPFLSLSPPSLFLSFSFSIDILRENGHSCATLEGGNLYVSARHEIGKWNSHRPLILSCNVERKMTFGHAKVLCNFLGMESIEESCLLLHLEVWKKYGSKH